MKLNWEKMEGLIPVIVQDSKSKDVLMLAYMNADALEITLKTGEVTFYSRSRKSIWTKGETSGNKLTCVEIRPDCDGDAILVLAQPTGPTCHRLTQTCFDAPFEFLGTLETVIETRFQSQIENGPSDSYVGRLLAEGGDRMAQKVGEEAIETVIASKNPDLHEFEGEAADLLFHLMVLLRFRNTSLEKIVQRLKKRQK